VNDRARDASASMPRPSQADALAAGLVELLADAVAERVLAALQRSQPAPSSSEPWRLLDVDGVGEMLGRSRRTVHAYVKDRGLPYIRLDNGALAFDPDDVKAWARARRVPAEDGETLAGRWQGGRNPASAAGSGNGRRTVKQKAGAS
jgi:predicted DNA-binding transcriptional regulator AlpA